MKQSKSLLEIIATILQYIFGTVVLALLLAIMLGHMVMLNACMF